MKLTLIGTGNALVSKCYNTCFLLSNEQGHFLVDGGGGNYILNQLQKKSIDYKDIKYIFVTHKHIDHLLGIIWLIRVICQAIHKGEYVGDAIVYAHEELIQMLHELTKVLLQDKQTQYINKRLFLVPVSDGETKNVIGTSVTFFDIHSSKAKQFGFTMNYEGKKLTCCGDEPYCDSEYQYAVNSTWLLHEAFCLYSERDIYNPYKKNHSTVKDACLLATKLNVSNLVLYHTEDDNLENRKSLYVNEGKKYFSKEIYVPDDLDEIII